MLLSHRLITQSMSSMRLLKCSLSEWILRANCAAEKTCYKEELLLYASCRASQRKGTRWSFSSTAAVLRCWTRCQAERRALCSFVCAAPRTCNRARSSAATKICPLSCCSELLVRNSMRSLVRLLFHCRSSSPAEAVVERYERGLRSSGKSSVLPIALCVSLINWLERIFFWKCMLLFVMTGLHGESYLQKS